MPGLARKLVICASSDGLILQPLTSRRESRPPPTVKVRYGDASVSAAHRDSLPSHSGANASFEAYGIVGLITVFQYSYLVSIVRRQQVAQIRGSAVYVVSEVALTPCMSEEDAVAAVAKTAALLDARRSDENAADESSGDDDDDPAGPAALFDNFEPGDDGPDAVMADNCGAGVSGEGEGETTTNSGPDGPARPPPPLGPLREQWSTAATANTTARSSLMPAARSSVAEDVIGRRGTYGRFAQSWFSRTGWAMDQKRTLGLSSDGSDRTANKGGGGAAAATAAVAVAGWALNKTSLLSKYQIADDGASARDAALSMLPRLLRSAEMLFGTSRTFYFSYDYDITRSLANAKVPATSLVPLYNHVDPTFFWNRHVIRPFIDASMDALVLPLMQGFVGQRSFTVDSQPPQVDPEARDSVELGRLSPKSRSAAAAASSSSRTSSNPASPPPGRKSTGAAAAAAAAAASSTQEPTMRPTERRFDMTLISRRSTKRAGLRYLRRGVDEDGNVANFVETEQLLSPAEGSSSGSSSSIRSSSSTAAAAAAAAAAADFCYELDPARKVYSFVQVRGSLALFFTQTPYSLRPTPVVQHSAEANFAACRRHFGRLRDAYGTVHAVSLVDRQGTEAAIGDMFARTVARLNEDVWPQAPLAFDWFDFHAACRGMKFENVALLLQTVGPRLDGYGSTVAAVVPADGDDGSSNNNNNNKAAGGHMDVLSRQSGVVRTNCMDCLDRTNVCQSAFAKHMLDAQLKEQGLDMGAQPDQVNAWFNTLWADNGDAISKQYASTGAMKGDYTRTKKRDYRGALADAGLSITRLFNGMFNDFFLQTTIDFLLGNVTARVFEEFEANMMTKDPAMSMQRLREQAIEMCQKLVVADEAEELVGGWTMLTPRAPDTVRATSSSYAGGAGAGGLEEAVLLLTDAAVYLARLDWTADKVRTFERVGLARIRKIRFGTYITSTITPAHTDELRNVGLVIEFIPAADDVRGDKAASPSPTMASGAVLSGPTTTSTQRPDAMAAAAAASRSRSRSRSRAGDKPGSSNSNNQQHSSNNPAHSGLFAPSSATPPSSPPQQSQPQPPTGFAGFLARTRRRSASPGPDPPVRRIALKALFSQTSDGPGAAPDEASMRMMARTTTATVAGDGGRRGMGSSSTTISAGAASGVRDGGDGGGGGGGVTRLAEVQQVVLVVAEIERLAMMHQPRPAGTRDKDTTGSREGGRWGGGRQQLVEKGDIISLAEAKRNTGLLEQLGYSIKKMVWA